MAHIKIEMIHDLVCSWCAIGYQHIQQALSDLGVSAQFEYLPAELNPDLEKAGIAIDQYFKTRYGWSDSKHAKYREELLKASSAANAGIDFRYRTHYYNTHLAHRLLMEAQNLGLATQAHELLLEAYHATGANIADIEVLHNFAAQLDMPTMSIARALDPQQTSEPFEQALKRRRQFEIPSVPAFVFNEEKLQVGSQSREFFKRYIDDLLSPGEFNTTHQESLYAIRSYSNH